MYTIKKLSRNDVDFNESDIDAGRAGYPMLIPGTTNVIRKNNPVKRTPYPADAKIFPLVIPITSSWYSFAL